MAAKSMAGERDPRTDPRRGDVLKREQEMRVVTTHQSERRVWYGEFVFIPDRGFNAFAKCEIEDWPKWATDATVIHRAEDL